MLGSASKKFVGNDFRSELANRKIEGNGVSFDEKLKFDDVEILIAYCCNQLN